MLRVTPSRSEAKIIIESAIHRTPPPRAVLFADGPWSSQRQSGGLTIWTTLLRRGTVFKHPQQQNIVGRLQTPPINSGQPKHPPLARFQTYTSVAPAGPAMGTAPTKASSGRWP